MSPDKIEQQLKVYYKGLSKYITIKIIKKDF